MDPPWRREISSVSVSAQRFEKNNFKRNFERVFEHFTMGKVMDRFWVVWRVCLAQILCVYDKRTHRGPSDFVSGALEQDVRILPPWFRACGHKFCWRVVCGKDRVHSVWDQNAARLCFGPFRYGGRTASPRTSSIGNDSWSKIVSERSDS